MERLRVGRMDPLTAGYTWSYTGSMATERNGHTATLLPDGKVLIAGGANGTLVTSAEVYDPGTGVWSPTGSLAEGRIGHTVTLLPDGKVLVAGGSGSSGNLSGAEVYDPGTGMWSPTGSLAMARRQHTATLLPDGKVLVTGGNGSGGTPSSAEVYNPGTGVWSPTGSLAGGRFSHTATLLLNGKVLVAGGESSSGNLSGAEVYDPATGAWSSTGSLSMARRWHNATLLPNGELLVTGGFGSSGTDSSAEVYDPGTGAWSTTSPLLIGRGFHTATLLPSGMVLVTGSTSISTNAELYGPPGISRPTGPLAEARTASMAVLLPKGQVLVAGGSGSSGSLASVEILDTSTGQRTTTDPMSTSRASSTATLLLTGEVLVAGGLGQAGSGLWTLSTDQALSSAELFNPETQTWRPTGPLNEARHSHSALLLSTGEVLVAGGVDSQGQRLSSVELYDPAKGTWRMSSPMLTSRQSPMVVQLPTGEVLVAGGLDARGHPLASVELYDPGNGKWTEATAMNAARASSTAALLYTGEVLVAGGTDGSQVLSSTEVYDPGERTWTEVGKLNTARQSHAAHLMPTGRVLVLGGSSGKSPLDGVEVYDPKHREWQVSTRLSTPGEDSTTVLLPTGTLLVIAGTNEHGPMSKTELHDEVQGSTRPIVRPLLPQKPGASLALAGSGFRGGSGDSGIVRLLIKPRGELRDLPTQELSDTSVQVTLTDVPDGYHLLFVVADDMSGGQVVHVDGTPPEAPAVTEPSAFVGTPQPKIAGTAEPRSTVEVFLDGQPEGTATANFRGNWSLVLATTLEERTYHLTARATDEAGNSSPLSEARSLTLDQKAPRAPEVLTPGEWVNDRKPTASGTSEKGSTVTVYVDGKKAGSTTVDLDGRWSHTLPEELKLTDGRHTVSATATDEAGNVSKYSTPRDFTVDTQPPPAPEVLTPQEGSTVATRPPVFSGKAEQGSTVTVLLNDGEAGTTTADSEGNWSVTQRTELEDGEYTVSVNTTDAAGNTSEATVLRITVSSASGLDDFIIVGGGGFGCTAGPGQAPPWPLGLTLLGWLLARRRPARA
ncbi:MAG TPA: kelch repeat-containing protein [Archangium sp.]|uniref:kelch repeat-containing protein n=1 Tax=Archangium sp. TaxID=1872627 RepID=UPI002E31B1E5|nr:kelch repeat-containing protein [Archangium sp.]HEX5753254.1 kelch repeat-containing protein [Archangium sp.]